MEQNKIQAYADELFDALRGRRVVEPLTDREPDIFVDVEPVYDTKLAACMAHRSQFPKGEESLEWMKELDKARGETIGVNLAESLKLIRVW